MENKIPRRSRVAIAKRKQRDDKEQALDNLVAMLAERGYVVEFVGKGKRLDIVGVTGKLTSAHAFHDWVIRVRGTLAVRIAEDMTLEWPFAPTREGATTIATRWLNATV